MQQVYIDKYFFHISKFPNSSIPEKYYIVNSKARNVAKLRCFSLQGGLITNWQFHVSHRVNYRITQRRTICSYRSSMFVVVGNDSTSSIISLNLRREENGKTQEKRKEKRRKEEKEIKKYQS